MMVEDYRIYHLNIIPNTEEIIEYLRTLFYDDNSYTLEKEDAGYYIPYMVMAEERTLVWKTENHEQVMKEISLRFPSVVFDLYSQGPQFEDIWKKSFKDSSMTFYQGVVTYQLNENTT